MSKKLIGTQKTEFEQNLKQFAIIDTAMRGGKPTMLSAKDLEEAFNNASSDDKQAFKDLLTFDLEGEERTVTPSKTQQVITPSQGKNAITKCTVNATPMEECNPTLRVGSSSKVYNPASGKVGFSKVTVPDVTAAIDSNIVAGNIKSGVTILGVTGTHSGGDTYDPITLDSTTVSGEFKPLSHGSLPSGFWSTISTWYWGGYEHNERYIKIGKLGDADLVVYVEAGSGTYLDIYLYIEFTWSTATVRFPIWQFYANNGEEFGFDSNHYFSTIGSYSPVNLMPSLLSSSDEFFKTFFSTVLTKKHVS